MDDVASIVDELKQLKEKNIKPKTLLKVLIVFGRAILQLQQRVNNLDSRTPRMEVIGGAKLR